MAIRRHTNSGVLRTLKREATITLPRGNRSRVRINDPRYKRQSLRQKAIGEGGISSGHPPPPPEETHGQWSSLRLRRRRWS